LKIAYFVNDYPKVSHSFIRREIRAVEQLGFEVQRIALRGWSGPLPDAEDQDERARTCYVLREGLWPLLLAALRALIAAPVRFLSALRLAVSMARESDRPLPYHLVYLAEACRILRWLTESRAGHVHAHFGTNSAEVVMLVRALGGPPYSFTVHGPDEFARPMGLPAKVGHARFVAAVSNFTRSQLWQRCRHEDWSKVQVIHCGLEPAFASRAAVSIPDAPRLVCVGRLCAAKGQLLLVEAAARLIAAGTALQLVLAGDGPLRPELEAQIAARGLSEHVHITGWISGDEVREQILAARALVLPSFAEGLPVVIMEALALRRPVLSTYIAGIPELVIPGENGWLIPAGSLDELTRALRVCVTTPVAQLQRMGDAGCEYVSAQHSAATEAAKLAQLFAADPEPGVRDPQRSPSPGYP